MKWSGIRNRLEKEFLAKKLRGRITYFCTTYSKCPDHEGRAAVRFDGREILKSGWFDYEWRVGQLADELCGFDGSYHECYETADNAVLRDGYFDQRCFYAAFDEFSTQSIEDSVKSENALVRMFAILDRRVGKRRLVKLAEKMSGEPEWLRRFYLIRLQNENMEVPQCKQKSNAEYS